MTELSSRDIIPGVVGKIRRGYALIIKETTERPIVDIRKPVSFSPPVTTPKDRLKAKGRYSMPSKESFIPRGWLRRRDKDLKAAGILLNENDFELAAFHLQQAIEKHREGYLLSKGWKLKRTHDLIDPLDEAVTYTGDIEDFREGYPPIRCNRVYPKT